MPLSLFELLNKEAINLFTKFLTASKMIIKVLVLDNGVLVKLELELVWRAQEGTITIMQCIVSEEEREREREKFSKSTTIKLRWSLKAQAATSCKT